eukprot:TRINITY_DN14848_c0_g1_i1.p1 TRINITY_DN14848_c0_g1~~TRINITY_DN14848_c0_g1_i1.p1  ORF type:complete len:893 (-),score=226.67 TRINITY_DN14848_c0_g1_i1:79-2757(-)
MEDDADAGNNEEKKPKKKPDMLMFRDNILRKLQSRRRPKEPSPLATLHEVFEETPDRDRFVGDSMFWKYFEDINTKRIYDIDSVEYKNLSIMFWETVFFVCLLVLFTLYLYSLQNSEVFHSRQEQYDYWRGCDGVNEICQLDRIRDVKTFWHWMTNDLIALAFTKYAFAPRVANLTTAFPNNNFPLTMSPRFIGPDMSTLLLGTLRLRQLRVQKNVGCKNSMLISHVYPDCYAAYSEVVESDVKYSSRFAPTYLADAFTWIPGEETKQQSLLGKLTSYGAGGFTIDLPMNDTDTRTMMSDLWEWRWLDRATRCIILELSTLNTNANVIVNTRILFEFGPEGAVIASVQNDAAEVHFFTLAVAGSAGYVFTLQILITLFFLAYNGWIFKLMYKTTTNYVGQNPIKFMRQQTWCGMISFLMRTCVHYFEYRWNILDFTILCLFYAHLAYRIQAYVGVTNEPLFSAGLIGHPEHFMPFSAVMWDVAYSRTVIAVMAIAMWVKPFKYLCMLAYFRNILRIMEQTIMRLSIFSVILIIIIFSFAISFCAGFGGSEMDYTTVLGSFQALCYVLLEGYKVDERWFEAGKLQLMPLVFLIYVVFIYFVLLNIFMAVVLDVYATTPVKLQVATGENPMAVFFVTYWNSLRGISKSPEDDEQHLNSEDLSIRLDLLPGLVRRKWIEKKRKMQRIARSNFAGLELFPGDDSVKGSNAKSLTDWMLPSSALEVEKMQNPQALKPTNCYDVPSAALDQEVSRSQLQRLMDEDETLPLLLHEDEAVEVIRKFKKISAAGVDPDSADATQVRKLQGEVFSRIDGVEAVNTDEKAPEVPQIKEMTEQMSGAISDVRNLFRKQLTGVIEATAGLFEHLVDLTQGIDAVRANHEDIVNLVKENMNSATLY